ncbi:MAG: hypothetical protein IJU79_04925 [Desulfovibrionaceae bacterium]|nr:hypothetical protein [Desulfovibrionaceae bacterium]
MIALDFNAKWYLQSKAAQLNAAAYKGKSNWTTADVKKAFAKVGLSPEEHYQKYSSKEGTTAYSQGTFDEDYYLESKVASLNAAGYKDADGNAYTVILGSKKIFPFQDTYSHMLTDFLFPPAHESCQFPNNSAILAIFRVG